MIGRMMSASSRPLHPLLVVLLGTLTMLPPLSIDVSLPGLPLIARALHAPGSSIGWTLSAFVLAFGAGQLALGPLSDRIGRRPVLLAGLGGFVLLAIACAFAPNVYILIVMRFAQGVCACAGTVCARAIVVDIACDNNSATRLQALVSATNSIAPILAPIVGVALLVAFGWRSLYGALAVVGIGLLIAVWLFLSETAPRAAGGMMQSYRRVLAEPSMLPIAAVVLCAFAAFFALISSSSLVLERELHVSSALFAIAFAVSASATLLGSFVAAKYARSLGSRGLFIAGVACIAGAAALVFCADIFSPSPVLFTLTMAMFAFSYGLLVPAAYAMALANAGADAGSGAALLGAAQMLGGAVGSALAAGIPLRASSAVAIVVLGCAGAVVIAFSLANKRALRTRVRRMSPAENTNPEAL